MKNILALVGGGVVLCVVLACIVAAVGGRGAAQGGSASSGSASSGNAAAPAASHGLNEDVVIGKATWRVSEATLASSISNSGFSADASGQFLIVKATVTNNGDQPESLVAPKVVDGQGREFEVTSDGRAIMANAENCTLERLNPGTSKSCAFVYDVPKEANTWTFRASELGFFGKTADIILGK